MFSDFTRTLTAQLISSYYLSRGISRYSEDFLAPLINATQNFNGVELSRLYSRNPQENLLAYSRLMSMNVDLYSRYIKGVLETVDTFSREEWQKIFTALHVGAINPSSKDLGDFFTRHAENLRRVIDNYPKTIQAIEPEYGFHFERFPQSLILETDRFYLHQVIPSKRGVTTDNALKPLLIIPPFVLGANILSFLPGEERSYAHSFANRSIPTYIRILKPIAEHPAVQTMTPEDDAQDTKIFCEKLLSLHGQQVTLNGYCQGGFSAICNILSNTLDGLVDALITCVTPIDGTRSQGLGKFLKELPAEFNDLAYGTKTLPNGNKLADGHLMGWIYKLKSIEDSGPLTAFYRDLMMLSPRNGKPAKISKSVAALNYWLQNERSDLPLPITDMSFRSYNHPISPEGILPVTLFGKKLDLHALPQKNIKWLLCYGESDDLVEKEVALAPLDFIDVEVTPFPKGHVAIATSWSHPESACALDSVFGEDKVRGPVRFQLDLSAEKQEK